MVRTHITALVALLTLLSANFALAFGLGELTLKSYLNQPFVAEIEIIEVGDLTQDEIIPKLATAKDFANVGLQRDFFLTELRFEVVIDDKSGRNYILVTTSEPVTEPFLDFLVEFLWPEGRLLREYTVLLDPPTYSAQSPQEQSIPVVEVAAVDNPVVNEVEPVVVENTAADGIEEVAVEEVAQAEQATEETSTSGEVVAETVQTNEFSRRTITTAPKDTLWSIAAQERPVTSVSVQQTMLAIQELNPDAFLHNNINYLKKNQVLRIPTEDEIRSLAAREALGIVADQNREWAGRTVASGGTLPADTAKLVGSRQVTPMGEGDEVGEQMKLVADTGEDGEAIGTSSGTGSGSNVDESARTSRQAAQLLSETKALKSQVETSERLISLKDQQIAELQARLAEKGADSSTSIDEEVNNVVERVAVAEVKDEIDNSKETSEEKEIAEALAEAESDAESATENSDENTTKAIDAEEQISFETKKEEPVKSKSAIKDIETPKEVVEEESSKTLFLALGLIVALLVLAGAGFFIYKKRVTKAAPSAGSEINSVEEDEEGFGGIDGFGDDEISDDAFGDNSGSGGKNVLTEADTYISFNRYTQAVDLLKKAISSGNDSIAVKTKLLEAYAGVGDRGAFDDLSEEILSEDSSQKSLIKKLASQLEVDTKPSFDMDATTRMNASDFDLDASGNEEEFDISLDDLANDLDASFSSEEEESLDSLDLSEEFAESSDDSFSTDTKKGGLDLDDTLVMHSQTVKISPKEESLELDLDDLSFDDDSSAETESDSLDISEDDGLDLDFDMDDELDLDSGKSTQVKSAVPLDDDLELDLDLGDELSFDEPEESANNDELDLSNDLNSDLDLDSDLNLDLDGDFNLEEDTIIESKDSSSDEESLFGDSDGEDFELPDDGDEAATKLDLARAYIDMGDEDGAKDILQEVIADGDASQKAEAKQLLDKL